MNCYYQYLPYTLKLNSPAIITGCGSDPNSSRTLPYIPGAAMRGAVASKLGDPGPDTNKQKEFFNLVLGGMVRYLPAYPLYESWRALPVPVSLRRIKDEPENHQTIAAYDLAAYEGAFLPDQDLAEIWPEEQLVAVTGWFLTIGSARPTLVRPEISARLHHQRDRQKGCAWKDKQGHSHGIFVYEALEAGQSFQGLLQIRGNTGEQCRQIGDRIKELLGELVLVGRSRRAGYGGMAEIKWVNSRRYEVEGTGSEGFRPVTGDLAPGDQFRLLLTSACIVRQPVTGQIDPAGLEGVISQALDHRARIVRQRWAFETIGGFNRKWRLETPQVRAVAAGSVFVLETNQSLALDDLRRLEDEGLGQRKEEGYGRILFLEAPLKKASLYLPAKPSPTEVVKGNPPQLVSIIEGRVLKVQVERKIEEAATEIAARASVLPTSSLLGRLRTALRGAPHDALATLTDWLQGPDDKCLKRPAMNLLERCRMGIDGSQITLAKWLMEATQKDKILEWLQVNVIAQRYYVVSESSAKEFIEEHWEEFSVRLIDSVLAAMALRNKEKEVAHES